MLNNVVLMGRLTADPELRHTSNGVAVTSFTLAVNRSYAKSGTERVADFIDIVAWRNTAEFVTKYFTKGQLVAVEGSIQTRTYQDKDGNNRKVSEVVVSNVYFAEAKREGANRGDFGGSNVPGGRNYQRQGEPAPSFENGSDDDFKKIPPDDDFKEIPPDDDLPF